MSQTEAFIRRLSNDRLFGPAERARLRGPGGRALDDSTGAFDLFAGLWWPLREKSGNAPRREVAWLVTKLYAAFALPQVGDDHAHLPLVMGRCEPRDNRARPRFRGRFDALLCAPLAQIEPHLRWALGAIANATFGRAARPIGAAGIDWVRLTDDLSLWDRGYNPADTRQKGRLGAHERLVGCGEMHRSTQDLWACEYLNAATRELQGESNAD